MKNIKTCTIIIITIFVIGSFVPSINSQKENGITIDIWYSLNQNYGHIGIPQDWVNILGEVSNDVNSLEYSLNGGSNVALTIGPDGRRLVNEGDFNIDISYHDLVEGVNEVVITAISSTDILTETVYINYNSGNIWPLPYFIDWSTVSNINDVAHVVDGKWSIIGDTVRTIEPGYDRLIAIGDVTWTDYEVEVPVTFHSGGGGTGLLLRWHGHTDNPVSGRQPKSGWLPLGAIGWYYNNGLEIYGNNAEILARDTGISLSTGVTYMFKMRVETIDGVGGLYSLKVWEQGTEEPVVWDLTGQEELSDPQDGSMMLISHQRDVSFGRVNITVLPPFENFTIIPLPDTQKYSASYPDIFTNQTQWIVDNREALNIVYVGHEGDIVDTASSTTQWDNANTSMTYLEDPVTTGLPDGICYSVVRGNHDLSSLYDDYFGVDRFEGRNYYGGHYSDNNRNNYVLFDVGDLHFISISLDYSPNSSELAWADGILQTYSDRRAIVVSHCILDVDGSWEGNGQTIYDTLKDNPNLFLMLCGHMHNESRRTETYNDNTVNILLADYQDYPNGGNGWLRIMEFCPATNEIKVKTYSPWLDSYQTDDDSQFTLSYDMTVLENNPPVVSDIPNQTIIEGESFATINLDDYVSDVEDAYDAISWSYSRNTDLTVDITDRVATVSYTGGWTGSETITFNATDSGGLFDTDNAVFTVNPVPGDANGDGFVDAIDITYVELIIIGLRDPTPGADANQDGYIDAIDITKTELIILG